MFISNDASYGLVGTSSFPLEISVADEISLTVLPRETMTLLGSGVDDEGYETVDLIAGVVS